MQNKSKTVLIPMILILLCIVTAVGITGLQHEQSNTMTVDDGSALFKVFTVLGQNGYDVTLQKEEPFFLQGDRYRLILNEDESTWVTVYVYMDVDAAQNDALTVDPDGFGVNRAGTFGTMESVQVSWVDTPHFFLYKNVIVQYIGNDSEIWNVLYQLCGDQFAGGSLQCGIDV